MRRIVIVAMAAGVLGACAGQGEMPPPPAVPVESVTRVETMAPPLSVNPYTCGQQVSAMLALKGKPPGDIRYPLVRVLPPNAMATMDYNPARLNVDVDARGNVLNARCG